MKKFLRQGLCFVMSIVPMFAMLTVIASSNSTACFAIGQPEPPKNLKDYRKF